MLCFSRIKTSFYLVLGGLLVLLFTVFINQGNNVLAVSDVTVTIDSTNFTSYNAYLCNGNCSSYNYVLIEGSNFSGTQSVSNSTYSGFYISYNYSGSSPFRLFYFYPYAFSTVLLDLTVPSNGNTPVNIQIVRYSLSDSFDWSGLFGSDYSVTFTLSENNPFSSCTIPSGSLSITENGTYDVTNYAEAVVDVSTSSGEETPSGDCDYTASLEAIRRAILTCGAILLLIYFFYCIYRIIIKSTGGN